MQPRGEPAVWVGWGSGGPSPGEVRTGRVHYSDYDMYCRRCGELLVQTRCFCQGYLSHSIPWLATHMLFIPVP
jgi:hypothetical protein